MTLLTGIAVVIAGYILVAVGLLAVVAWYARGDFHDEEP